ncbi:MAG: DinB family protein [Proteobacteria bacterium]|nr:DinB family protein [Pseudomonadota bacterium]
MIDAAYVRRMARYNRWQNESLYGAASRLSEAERRRDRGAFFGSIHATLAHLVWADRLWLARFELTPVTATTMAEGLAAFPTWPSLQDARVACDAEIVRWADALTPDGLAGDLAYYSMSAHREIGGLRWVFVAHFFNHQTHHRGQAHCLLTQCGLKLQDTDLQLMPE